MFDFLPEKYRSKAFIAGGWAACPAMATDRDVWVTIDTNRVNFWEEVNALQTHLMNRAVLYEFIMPDMNSHYPIGTIKVGDLIYPWEKVQVLATGLEPEQLLEDFDISTHQIAIMSNGRVVKGRHWTPVTAVPTIIRTNGPTSITRFEKISKRFGHDTKAQAFWQKMKGRFI